MKIGRIISIALALFILLRVGSAVHAENLIMGLIPAENNEEIVQRFEPMRAYLEKKIGRPISVARPTASSIAVRPGIRRMNIARPAGRESR